MQSPRVEKVADRQEGIAHSRQRENHGFLEGLDGDIETIQESGDRNQRGSSHDEDQSDRPASKMPIQVGVVWPGAEGCLPPEPSRSVSIKRAKSLRLETPDGPARFVQDAGHPVDTMDDFKRIAVEQEIWRFENHVAGPGSSAALDDPHYLEEIFH